MCSGFNREIPTWSVEVNKEQIPSNIPLGFPPSLSLVGPGKPALGHQPLYDANGHLTVFDTPGSYTQCIMALSEAGTAFYAEGVPIYDLKELRDGLYSRSRLWTSLGRLIDHPL